MNAKNEFKEAQITPLSEDWLLTAFERFYATSNAFCVLASTHGYSLSELAVEVKSSVYPKTFIFLNGAELTGIVRVENPNGTFKSVRIMLDTDANPLATFEPKDLISYLNCLQNEGFTRIYTYLLTHEENLKLILNECGFNKEALLEEHVFVNGEYVDLEIWGTSRTNQL